MEVITKKIIEKAIDIIVTPVKIRRKGHIIMQSILSKSIKKIIQSKVQGKIYKIRIICFYYGFKIIFKRCILEKIFKLFYFLIIFKK